MVISKLVAVAVVGVSLVVGGNYLIEQKGADARLTPRAQAADTSESKDQPAPGPILDTENELSSSSLEQIVQKVCNKIESIDSIDVEFTTKVEIPVSGQKQIFQERFTQEGPKFREEIRQWLNVKTLEDDLAGIVPEMNFVTVVRDGVLKRHFIFPHKSGKISNNITQNIQRLVYKELYSDCWFGLDIPTLLKTSAEVKMEDHPEGINLNARHYGDHNDSYSRFLFSKDDYSLLRWEFYSNKNELAKNVPRIRLVINAFTQVGQLKMPTHAVREAYLNGKISSREDILVTKIQINKEFGANYNIDFPPLTLVYDEILGRSYTVGKSKVVRTE